MTGPLDLCGVLKTAVPLRVPRVRIRHGPYFENRVYLASSEREWSRTVATAIPFWRALS